MTHVPFVSTIIAPKRQKILTDEIVGDFQYQLGGDSEARWLEQGVAVDLFHEQAQPALSNTQYDCITQSTQHRKKQMLIADMDSTLIEQECIDELAAYVGIKNQIAQITQRAMNGELAFEAALRERVALLKGLPEDALRPRKTSAVPHSVSPVPIRLCN